MSDSVSRTIPAAEVAAFVTELTYDDLPAVAVERAERCVLDTVGVAIAGAEEEAGAVAREVTADLASDGNALVFGADRGASPTDAAFANGTAAHCLDFDDVSAVIHIHPSTVLVPAMFAIAGTRGVSGEELVTAYVAGFETMDYLVAPINPEHYERGWHATSTIGALGATASVASLLDLDRETTTHAINVAASTAAGLKRNFGSMTKPMHAGQAARAGVTTALLAERGFTAAADTYLDDKGFYDMYRGDAAPDLTAFPELGEQYAIVERGVEAKKYPCCYFTHSSIAAASKLANEHDITPSDVAAVHVSASGGAGDALLYEDPHTGLEAKFSMHYTVASAIARDRIGLAAFEDENLDHAETQTVRKRVTFEVDPAMKYGGHRAIVDIELTDGETISHEQAEPPGTLAVPLSEEEISEKYLMCVRRAIPEADAQTSYEWLSNLREQEDLSGLVDYL